MNRKIHNPLRYLLLSLGFMLTACGGSGGIDGSGAPANNAPIMAGPVSTTGAINGFGSVIVNGVHYNSDKANILINGDSSSELHLRAGYQVRITGSIAKDGLATADTIEFRPDLVGKITAIDLNTQQLSVLGRQVQITANTLFDTAIAPNYLNGLSLGDTVLISGAVDELGMITATRIERSALALQLITGTISQVNSANRSFTVSDIRVDYSSADVIDVGNNGLQSGDKLSVYGQLDAATGTFKATKIARVKTALDTTIKLADFEGFIGSVMAPNEFKLLGLVCKTGPLTQFENGTAADLRVGAAIRLTGSVNAQGEISVQTIEFKKVSNNEIVGEVSETKLISQTNTPNLAAVLTGTLVINNTLIATTPRTVFEDNSKDLLHRFNFSSIRIKDFLKVSGFSNDQGVFIAVKIQRAELKENESTVLQLNGLISATQEHSFKLFEQTIYTNSNTEIRNIWGQAISEADFYAQANGKRVAVLGTLINGQFTATLIRLGFEKDMKTEVAGAYSSLGNGGLKDGGLGASSLDDSGLGNSGSSQSFQSTKSTTNSSSAAESSSSVNSISAHTNASAQSARSKFTEASTSSQQAMP